MNKHSQHFLGTDNFWYTFSTTNPSKTSLIKKITIKLKNKNKDYLKKIDLKKLEDSKNITISTSSEIKKLKITTNTFLGFNSFTNINLKKENKEISYEGQIFQNLSVSNKNFIYLGVRRKFNENLNVKLGYRKMTNLGKNDILQALVGFKWKFLDFDSFNFLGKIDNNLDKKKVDVNFSCNYGVKVLGKYHFKFLVNSSNNLKWKPNFAFSCDLVKSKFFSFFFYFEKNFGTGSKNFFLYSNYLLNEDFKIHGRVNSKKILDLSTVWNYQKNFEFINSIRMDFNQSNANFLNLGLGFKFFIK